MNVIFLVIDFAPHQVVIIKELLDKHDANVLAISMSAYINPDMPLSDNFRYLVSSDFTDQKLIDILIKYNADMIVCAGWFVKRFVKVCKILKNHYNIPIVATSDTQWRGSIRQRINCLISNLYLKRAFTHLWVAGLYQYEYAHRLGYKNEHIIFNSLSCNTELFNCISISDKIKNYPKNFLFVGRNVRIKGIELLLDAWINIKDKKGWSLTIITDKYSEELSLCPEIKVKTFIEQKKLLDEFKNSGCLILPSLFEPWAVVLHEAASAGLPIICTNVCGAAPYFAINGYNGIVIEPANKNQIIFAMEKIIGYDTSTLIAYSKNSRKLAQRINPEITSYSLLSIINSKV